LPNLSNVRWKFRLPITHEKFPPYICLFYPHPKKSAPIYDRATYIILVHSFHILTLPLHSFTLYPLRHSPLNYLHIWKNKKNIWRFLLDNEWYNDYINFIKYFWQQFCFSFHRKAYIYYFLSFLSYLLFVYRIRIDAGAGLTEMITSFFQFFYLTYTDRK